MCGGSRSPAHVAAFVLDERLRPPCHAPDSAAKHRQSQRGQGPGRERRRGQSPGRGHTLVTSVILAERVPVLTCVCKGRRCFPRACTIQQHAHTPGTPPTRLPTFAQVFSTPLLLSLVFSQNKKHTPTRRSSSRTQGRHRAVGNRHSLTAAAAGMVGARSEHYGNERISVCFRGTDVLDRVSECLDLDAHLRQLVHRCPLPVAPAQTTPVAIFP